MSIFSSSNLRGSSAQVAETFLAVAINGTAHADDITVVEGWCSIV